MDAAAQTRRSLPEVRSTRFVALAACLLALSLGGCRSWPGFQCTHAPKIDPTGQRVFTYDTPYEQRPGPVTGNERTAVMVSPAKIIAPVGTEVIVQAAVCGPDKTLMAGEKVEWSIAPNSVGYFVQAGESGPLDWLHHVSYHSRKIDNTFAVSATSPKFIMLNRGTPEATDDVPVLRGQAWATVSSPVEGTSFVAAVAPDVRNWNSRKQTTTVYWVDCQWTFPPPAINPQGTRHVFTTLLVKHSNKCPLAGYRVRYEIAGGPPAGFAPNGSQIVEVTSNALGQAPVEIFQQTPAAGTNQINIQVIRPADWPGGDGTQLVVGSGKTTKTWTTSVTGLNIDKSGPTEVAVGGTITYRIDIRNPSDLSARGVVVTDAVPAGLMLLGSNPPASVNGNNLQWQLGDLPAGTARSVELSFRAMQPGVVNNCATVQSADGVQAQDCAATTVTNPTIEITMTGPPQAAVGEDVTFITTVTNRGASTANGLVLVDRFDAGLKHEFAASPIENRELGSLQPGESRKVNVRLRVVQEGRWCNTMELSGDGGIRGSAQACLTAVAATVPAAPPAIVTPPPSTTPAAGQLPQLVVRKTSPVSRAGVGDRVLFNIEIENRGQIAATNLRLVDNYDFPSLRPTQATSGWQPVANGNDLQWTLASLAPGQIIRYQVETLCEAPGARVCNRATLTSAEGARADAEACLEITGRQATLTIDIQDRTDPAPVGNEVAYDITVRNLANVSERNVAVTVELPTQMTPGNGHGGPTQFTVENRTVRFAPIAELRPGESQVFRVMGIARERGSATARATAASQTQQTPVAATTSTSVF
jgi:uncharacterized repeat protein (TIGR01451 family)